MALLTHQGAKFVYTKTMLTTELKLNGVVVGLITMVNQASDYPMDTSVYKVEIYIPSESGQNGHLFSGEVVHNPKDGALNLIQKAINIALKSS